jgi:hypothetical protein
MRAGRVARCAFGTTVAAIAMASPVYAQTVVQIPLDELLNGRPVSTFTGGKVVPWTAGQGIDSDDGFVTQSVEAALGQSGVALPDDGRFAADADHPEVVLHFSDAAPATDLQTHYVHGPGSFQFSVPTAQYEKLYLFMTSSYGDSPLKVTMTYVDDTLSTTQFTLPDWGTGQPLPTDPPIFFNLASGLHKWNAADQQGDAPVHTITGVVLAPSSDQPLKSVTIAEMGTTQYLLLWGATGIAAASVDLDAGEAEAGADASTDASAGAGTDASARAGTDAGAGADGGADADAGAGAGAGSGAGSDADARAGAGTDAGSASEAGGLAFAREPADSRTGCSMTTTDDAGARAAPWPVLAMLLTIVRRRARRRRGDARTGA